MDPGCDMIKRADLAVIGNSSEILAALIELATEYRQGDARDAA